MIQIPDAIPDDGLFDMTVIRKMRKLELIKSLSRLYDGTITQHPKVDAFRGRRIEIKSESYVELEVDGEYLGHAPFKFDIIPQSIGIVVSKEIYFQKASETLLQAQA